MRPSPSIAVAAASTSTTWWCGRPPIHYGTFNIKPDLETMERAAKPTTPIYTRSPADVYAEKTEMYKALYDARVTKEEEATCMEDRVVEGVGVTIFSPPSERTAPPLRGVCLHCHGGGWLFGDARYQNASKLLQWARDLRMAVVSVDYRLGPEHRYPAALNDVYAVAKWLLTGSNAKKEFGTDVVVGSGESAGAQLLALAALKLRDDERQQPPSEPKPNKFRCLNLVYGVYDMNGSPSVLADGHGSGTLSGNELLWMVDQHLPLPTSTTDAGTTIDRRSPQISPLYADLTDMPPALFTVGTADPLRDDTLFMATRYGAAGCDAELAVYAGGQHGLGHFGPHELVSLGLRARQHTQDYLDKFLSP